MLMAFPRPYCVESWETVGLSDCVVGRNRVQRNPDVLVLEALEERSVMRRY